ncbi:MAG: hypothetical protein GXY50_05790 [Syntrophomonadaceae bacterium]|nr:hypothetical protein [Syntrophomonadaceae bacterium]
MAVEKIWCLNKALKNQKEALVNGKTVPIDVDNPNIKLLLINGRTMLPLR